MTDFSQIRSALAVALQDDIAQVQVVRANELHCRIARGAGPRLAQMLRAAFQTELALMVANDRRADQVSLDEIERVRI